MDLLFALSRHYRINRYIMECKSKSKLTGEWLYIELIDTLWNVNLSHQSSQWQAIGELIDTLWNVNAFNPISYFYNFTELIDTLWNVNYADGSKPQVRKRINRYIMECKFECGRCSSVKA